MVQHAAMLCNRVTESFPASLFTRSACVEDGGLVYDSGTTYGFRQIFLTIIVARAAARSAMFFFIMLSEIFSLKL